MVLTVGHHKKFGTTAVDVHPIVLAYRTGKKVYWSNPHPSVILSSENGRTDVVKEGASKFIKKNYTGYTEAICKTKFVNGLSPNF